MKVLMRVNDILTLYIVSLCVAALVNSAAVRQSREEFIEETKQRCSRDFRLYYDHGTENCEECREICVDANIMGTEEQCRDYCPEYLEMQKCMKKEDSYYDENLSVCTRCSSICDNHESMGTTDECRSKCSAYLAKQDPPQQVPSNQEVNSLQAVHGEDGTSDGSSISLHPGWIATIIIGCVAVICTTLVAIVLVRTCSNQYTQAATEDGTVDGNNRSKRPIEETIRRNDSPHFAISGVGNPAVTTQAFSDLPDDRSRGSQRPVLASPNQ